MYKLKIDNYDVEVKNEKNEIVKVPYDVKETIATLALGPLNKHNGLALLKINAVVKKVLECKEDTIMLEDAEFDQIKRAIMGFEGLTRAEVQLCARFKHAEHIDANDVKKK